MFVWDISVHMLEKKIFSLEINWLKLLSKSSEDAAKGDSYL